MNRLFNTPRFFVEFVITIVLTEAAVMYLLPVVAPGVEGAVEALLDALMLALLSGPVILWRVTRLADPKRMADEPHSPAHRRGLVASTVAALLIGLGVTGLLVYETHRAIHRDAESRFERLADRVTAEVHRRDDMVVYELSGVRSLYAASKSVERGKFRKFFDPRRLYEELPCALGIGFIQRVGRTELEAFIAAERADEAPDFTVRTSGEAPDLYVIKFIEPLERNRTAWGFDVGSDPVRRAAVEQAVRTGLPTLVGRFQLVQDEQERAGLLYLLAVYRNGTDPQTPEEREAALAGLVYAPIVAEEFFGGLAQATDQCLDPEVFEGTETKVENLLVDFDGHMTAAGTTEKSRNLANRLFWRRDTLEIGGRTFTLRTSTLPKFEAGVERLNPVIFGMGGCLLSLLLAAVVWTIGTGRARAMALARSMTSDLAAAQSAAEEAFREAVTLRRTVDEHSIVSVTDTSGRIIDANDLFCRISGYSRAELIGQDHRLVNSGHHPKSFWVEAWRTVTSGRPWRSEVCNRAKDGSLYWTDSIIAPFKNAAGENEKYVSIRTDITERKRAEDELRLRAAHATLEAEVGSLLTRPLPLSDVLSGCAAAIVKHLEVAFARVWTLNHDTQVLELQASAGLYTHLNGPHSRVPVGQKKIGLIAQERKPHLTNQVVGDDRVGDQEWAQREGMVAFAGYPIIVEQRVEGVLAVFSRLAMIPETFDVLAHLVNAVALAIGRHRAENELRVAARTDKLTTLPNRALFQERLHRAVLRAQSQSDYHFAVLFLDFDRFKVVNDSLGHDVGDLLLQQIAKRLKATVRPDDSLSRWTRGHTAARLGGDEFVLLLNNLAATKDVSIVADRLLGVLSAPYRLGDHEIYSTASIGIVTSDSPHQNADEVLRNADIAMYEAKVAGRARYVVFDASMHERVRRRHDLENDLRQAVESGQLFLVYQPIVSLQTGQVVNHEALVRWNHPTRGLIMPGEFIPIAEDSSLIIPLGEWTLKEACRQFAQWRKHMKDAAPGAVSVNLSRVQLMLSDLPDTIQRILCETGVAPSCLHLEVTESAIMRDVETSKRILTALKKLGVKLAMDDFGTGQSSLASLHQFPVDVLKIDRSFVANLNRGRDFIALVHAVANLAHNLRIEIVAEGIETADQLALLQSLDCQFGQGYLFSKPLDAAAVPQFKVRSPLFLVPDNSSVAVGAGT